MKRKLSFVLALIMLFASALSASPFFASAAAIEGDADFKMTAPDGTITYHNADEFTKANSPTLATASSNEFTKLEMLRDVTYGYNFWIYGNVNFIGNNHKYIYTGNDYAFCVANDTSTTDYGVYPAESAMKRAVFTKLKLTGAGTVPNPNGGLYPAGGFKFYNSILELGDGNEMSAENYLVMAPRNAGKVIVSGGHYTNGGSTNIFDISGNSEGYLSAINFEMTGGTIYSLVADDPDKAVPLAFSGNTSNPSACSATISGGTIVNGGVVAIIIQNAKLNITGGTIGGDIQANQNVAVTLSGNGLAPGCNIFGTNNITNNTGVEFSDPIVAKVYIGGAESYQFTRREFIRAFSISYSSSLTKNVLVNNSYRLEILEDFETFRTQLGIYTRSGKTVTVNGNGKTLYGTTGSNPILRAYGAGTVDFNQCHLYNRGASCFQFYGGVTVNINGCTWEAPSHRVIFPTNSGTININEGSVLRGGQSVLYFYITANNLQAVINVNSGATLIGINNSAIAFQAGSKCGTVNIKAGAQVRVKDDTKNVIQFAADYEETQENGSVIDRICTDNNIYVNGGILEGNIANSSSGTNTINLTSGTIYTNQTRDEADAVNGTTISPDPQFVFRNPELFYVITIPELITFEPEKSENIGITADLWHFGATDQVAVSVSSANGFQLEYQGSGNLDPYSYTLLSSQMGTVAEGSVAAVFGKSDDGSLIDIQASIDAGQSPSIYAGTFSDTLTFTISYTSDEAALLERPVAADGEIGWYDGYISSEFHGTHDWVIGSSENIKYSDLIFIPEKGTTITFRDYYDPSINATNMTSNYTTLGPTPFTYAIFSSWTCKNGIWEVQRDMEWGTVLPSKWYDHYPATTGDTDINRRGHRTGFTNNLPYAKYTVHTETIDDVEHTYMVWTYTTLVDNQAIRLCYADEYETSVMASVPSIELTITPPN